MRRGQPGPAIIRQTSAETPVDIIRDPLWNNIRLDPLAFELIDTPAFQRLRYVRQLGLAFLVYPGATHSRFEHALGTYHLARRVFDAVRGPRRLRVARPRGRAADSRRGAAARHRTLSVLARARGNRRVASRGGRSSADLPGRGREPFCGASSATMRPNVSIALIRGREREPAAGAHLRLDRSRQARLSPPRRVHVRRELRRDRRRPPAQRADARARPRHGSSARRHGREGTVGARVAAVRASIRCTATCIGITRCAARRRCTSGWWPTRSTPARSTRDTLAAFTDEGLLHDARRRAPSALLARFADGGCTSAPSSVRRPI